MKTKYLSLRKTLSLALVLILVGALAFGTVAFFSDRDTTGITITTAKFSKNGYTIIRTVDTGPYVSGETIAVDITEENAKNEPVQSIVTLTAQWESPDTTRSPFGNDSDDDNVVIKIDGTQIPDQADDPDAESYYSYDKESGKLTIVLPAHKMDAESTDNKRQLTFGIPKSLKSTGTFDIDFTGVKLAQTTSTGGTGFYAEYSSTDLNAAEKLDFTADVIWDFSKDQNKSLIGKLTGTNGNFGIQVTGSGEMYNWTSEAASKHSVYQSTTTSLNLGEGMTTIGNHVFDGFNKVTSLTIPESVTTIGVSSFEDLTLTSLTIPSGVTQLGEMSFGNIEELTTITFKGNPTFPTAGEGTGAFYVGDPYSETDPLRTKIVADNSDVLNYNWTADHRGYTVTVETVEGGTLTADPDVAVNGKTITLNPTPADQYGYNGATVTYKDEKGTEQTITLTADEKDWTFTMPAADVTVTPKWTVTKPVLAANSSWFDPAGEFTYEYNGQTYNIWRQNIDYITIVDSYEPTNSEMYSWDASEAKNGSVMAYIKEDANGLWELIISGNGSGKIYANPDSDFMFSDESFLDGYQRNTFDYVTSITGMNLIDFSEVTGMKGMFASCSDLEEIDLSTLYTNNCTDMSYVFYWCRSLNSVDLSKFVTNNVTNMSNMFYMCELLTTLDVSTFNTAKVTDMSYMFSSISVTELDISNFVTSEVTTMEGMFLGCSSMSNLKWDTSKFTTAKVENMGRMFESCELLTSLDLKHFNTSAVNYMNSMFRYCSGLTSLDVSKFDTSNVSTMQCMFDDCSGLTSLNITNFDTSNVENMYSMFSSCSGLTELDLSYFETGNVTNAMNMFSSCTKLETIYATDRFDASGITDSDNMFGSCNALVGGANTPWDSSVIDATRALVDGGQGNPGYFTNNIFLSYADIYVTETSEPQLTIKSKVFSDSDSVKYEILSGSEYASVNKDTGVVTGNAAGTATVKVTLTNTNGDTISTTATVNVTIVAQAIFSADDNSLTFVKDKPYAVGETFVDQNGKTKAVTNVWTDIETTQYYCETNYGELIVDCNVPWINNFGGALQSNVKSVAVRDVISPVSTAGWFAWFENCTEFELDKLDTSNVTDMDSMFFFVGSDVTDSVVLDVSDLNTSNVSSMRFVFYGAGNRSTDESFCITGLDNWDTSNVTDMEGIFSTTYHEGTGDYKLEGLSQWDTSKVTNMRGAFGSTAMSAKSVDIGDISNWDTSNVTDMSYMFISFKESDESCELDLSGWDASKVTDMNWMFNGANAHTIKTPKNISTSVDITDITTKTFYDITDNNKKYVAGTFPVGNGATSHTLTDTIKVAQAIYSEDDNSLTFVKDKPYAAGETFVDQNGKTKAVTAVWTGIETTQYDAGTNYKSTIVSNEYLEKITSVSVRDEISPISTSGWFSMFTNCTTFDLEKLDTSHITDMSSMFYGAGAYATTFDIGGLSGWDTSKVTNMYAMFANAGLTATTFDIGNLGEWDTHLVENMKYMFQSAGQGSTTFNIGDLSGWDTSKVTDMGAMFMGAGYSATTFDIGNLGEWDTHLVENMGSMFYSAGRRSTTFDIGDLSGWDTSKVTNMYAMFMGAGGSATTFDIGNLGEWDTHLVENMGSMFQTAGYSATTFNIGDLSGWDTSKVTNMYAMFANAGITATTFDIGNLGEWDTHLVENMGSMFNTAGYSATTFNIGNLDEWDTHLVENMGSMFNTAGYSATTFNIGDLSGWDTSKVTNMDHMFNNAGYSATTFNIGDLRDWNTAKVPNMEFMFGNAGYSATTFNIGDLSGWDTSEVTDMTRMFDHAGFSATTFDIGDLSGWNTSKVTNMDFMFYCAGMYATTFNIGDLSGWDTSKVTNMQAMFMGTGVYADSFELDLSGWDATNVTSMNDMFYNTNVHTIKTPKNIPASVDITDITNKTFYDITDNNKKYVAGTFPVGNGATSHTLTDTKPITYAASLALTPPVELPEGVTAGTACVTTEMPNVEDLTANAAASAPENTVLYAWLVDSGMAKEIVPLEDLADILSMIYELDPNWEMTLTPLYEAVADEETETVETEETEEQEETEATETAEKTESEETETTADKATGESVVNYQYAADNNALVSMTMDAAGGYNVVSNEGTFSITLNEAPVVTGSIITKDAYQAICETDFTQEGYSGYETGVFKVNEEDPSETGRECIRWCYTDAASQASVWHYIVVLEEADLAVHFETSTSAEALNEVLSRVAFAAEQLNVEPTDTGSNNQPESEPESESETQPGTATVYAITYEANGGTMPETYASSYEAGQSVTLAVPAKEGYTFSGWYETAEFTGDAVTEITNGSSDKAFYAKWEEEVKQEPSTEPAEDTTSTEDSSEETTKVTSEEAANNSAVATASVTNESPEQEEGTTPSSQENIPAQQSSQSDTEVKPEESANNDAAAAQAAAASVNADSEAVQANTPASQDPTPTPSGQTSETESANSETPSESA